MTSPFAASTGRPLLSPRSAGRPSLAARAAGARTGTSWLGLTAYGCDRDEAALFAELSPRFGVDSTITTLAPSEAATNSLPRNRCISVGHRSEVTAATLEVLRELGVEYVSSRSRGLNHIDLAAAESLGITVENVGYAPDGVADYAVMLILMAVRNAKPIVSSAERHDFRLGRVRGRDLRDLTVGVVGVGQIGAAVIERLHGFGCRILAQTSRRSLPAGAIAVPLATLLRESDVVTLHLPLNAETTHLIGEDQLREMKRGAVLVNTGRGGLVDTHALTQALERGRLAGAALDVIEGEEGIFYVDRTGSPFDHPYLERLQRLPNVLITPHTAYYTERVLHDTVEATLHNCVSFAGSRADA